MMFVVGRSFVTSVVVVTGLSAVSVTVGEVGLTGDSSFLTALVVEI